VGLSAARRLNEKPDDDNDRGQIRNEECDAVENENRQQKRAHAIEEIEAGHDVKHRPRRRGDQWRD
jgi:hypothetical protein